MLVTELRFKMVIKVLDELSMLLDSYDTNCLQDRLSDLSYTDLCQLWQYIYAIEKIIGLESQKGE